METTTAAQERLVRELLAWGTPRPAVDPALADRLHEELEAGARAVLERHGLTTDGPRERYEDAVWVSKSRLDRLVCDGLYRAMAEEPFTFNAALAVGTLSHRAIEVDHADRRTRSPQAVVAHVWRETVTRQGDALADYCNGLDELAASTLQQDVEQLLTEHRDVWPVLPSELHVRMEQLARVELLGGRVVLLGTPDLTIGAVRDEHARMLLVDLKTGLRRPQQERDELRFYALLLTLKHRQPPFRWAVYYVAEGAWDHEDLTEELLQAAVRRTLAGVEQAVRLRDPDAEERLRVGRWCRFCPRRDACPAYLSQGDGTLGA